MFLNSMGETSGDVVQCTGGNVPLWIGPSSLGPSAGRGVFAGAHIPKGTVLCEYGGDVVHPSELTEAELDNGYTFLCAKTLAVYVPLSQTSTQHAVSNPGILINDPLNPRARNVRYSVGHRRRGISIVATKRITKGEELYAYYGPSYWTELKPDHDVQPVAIRIRNDGSAHPVPLHSSELSETQMHPIDAQ